MKQPELLPNLETLAEVIAVSSTALFDSVVVEEAERALREAAASRNGSATDAHLLVLAWGLDADLWSTDRDFAGVGVASWSTPNLMRAFWQAAV